MFKESHLDLPMFLHVREPITAVIINNQIVDCSKNVFDSVNADQALSLLHKLYYCKETNEYLPKELSSYFGDSKSEATYPCLIGDDDGYCGWKWFESYCRRRNGRSR